MAIERGHDRRSPDPALRAFFYLPFELFENRADQDYGVALSGKR